ncbi:MAG: acyl-CoA dehydrogenase [Sphingomonadales bacterium]|nr:MAG: acyl-CoA dehydrogenase [Sphingomonadales bacterium]
MQELIDPFDRLIVDNCPLSVVRDIERGGDWRPVWQAIVESGFLDALVPEEAGGFGLSLRDIAPLVAILGARAVPLPVGETMIARALLAQAGIERPETPLVLATGNGAIPLGGLAGAIVSGPIDAPRLAVADATTGMIPGTLDRMVPAHDEGLRAVAAVLRAMLIAGAAEALLDTTVRYASDRQQFGKPISRQQAVQQQLAVLAQHAVAARISAAIGARGGIVPSLRDAATAKIGAGTAAAQAAAIAHAVHGAIGISEEFDLQLLTRRLHAWRLADGSERYWAERLGAEAMASGTRSALDFALA